MKVQNVGANEILIGGQWLFHGESRAANPKLAEVLTSQFGSRINLIEEITENSQVLEFDDIGNQIGVAVESEIEEEIAAQIDADAAFSEVVEKAEDLAETEATAQRVRRRKKH